MTGAHVANEADFNAVPAPIIVYEPASGRILAVNDSAVQTYGFDRARFLAMTLADLHPPEDRVALQDGIPPTVGRHRKADGSVIDVEIAANPATHAGRAAMVALVRDITAAVAAERERRAAAEMLRIAGNAAGIGGWRADLDTGRVTWSRETCAIYGIPPETPLDYETALGFFTDADRARIEAAFAACRTDGTPYDFDVTARRADGTTLPLRAIGQPIRNGDGRIVAVQGAVQDLTRLRSVERSLDESRRMMRDFAEAMPHVVWFAEPDGTVAYASSRLRTEPDTADGFDLRKDWPVLLHPDDRDRLMRVWHDSVASGTDYAIEVRVQRDPAVGYRWNLVTARPQRDGDGRILRWFGLSTDIDDRYRAEAEAQRLAGRLRATLDSITDAFITLDRDWRLTFLNREAERVLRQPASDLLGRVLWDAFPEARGTVFETEYRTALEHQQTRRFQAPYPPLGVWFEVSAYPSEDGLSIYFRDVTAKRATDERLRLLELAISRINDCVLITEAEPLGTPGPRILFVNDAFTAQTGYAADDVMGRTPRVLQGPETDPEALHRIGAALRDWRPVREEVLNYRKDGSTFWIELDIVPLQGDDGLCTHWVGVQRDVTERKLAEARTIRHAAQLEATVTALQNLTALTVRGPALFEAILAEAVRLTGASGAALLDRGDDGWTARAVRGAAAPLGALTLADGWPDGAAQTDGRVDVVTRAGDADGPPWDALDGGQVAAMAAVAIRKTKAASPVLAITLADTAALEPTLFNSLEIFAGAIGVLLDRHLVEDQLRQAQRLEAVGQLTGGIAHDFNNLLTIILGNAELLAESLSSDQQLRMLAEMTQTAAERGAELTNRLLAFSRRQALDPKATDVGVLLRDMNALLRRSLGEQIELEVIHGGGLWPAMVDAPQLESALLNLSINARDAMQGGGRLTIETRNAHLDPSYAAQHTEVTPGQYVMIAVSDTGCGMPPDVVARAFEPFFTTKPVGKGSGLGLSMVFGFVKQSQGHVRIYSEPGEGTTVRLYLPRALCNATLAEAEEGQARHEGQGHILLVEDDDLVRAHVAGQLRDLGYRVVAVPNAAEALEALRQIADFDLLFTDVVMPGGMNGRELAEQAKTLRPALPVLFTSGYTENAIVHHGRLDAGVHLLTKPYRRRDLAAKLQVVLSLAGRGDAG